MMMQLSISKSVYREVIFLLDLRSFLYNRYSIQSNVKEREKR